MLLLSVRQIQRMVVNLHLLRRFFLASYDRMVPFMFLLSWYCISVYGCAFSFVLNLYMSKTCPVMSSWKSCLSAKLQKLFFLLQKCGHEDGWGFVYFKEQSMSKILMTSFLCSLASFYSQSLYPGGPTFFFSNRSASGLFTCKTSCW